MAVSQTDLEGHPVAAPPAAPAGEGLVLCAEIKDIAHHSKGGGTNTIAVFANLPGKDEDGKRLGTMNLNLNNLKAAGLEALAQALGVEEVVDNTPLLVKIFVPTGALVEHWAANRPGKGDDKE